MKFYLGTCRPNWLKITDVPLMVSHRTLGKYRTCPQAKGPWVLDSGGFTEVSTFGEWRTPTGDYVSAVRRYLDEVGQMVWAAPQDWMCEPFIVAKTGKTVADHQRLTTGNYLLLASTAPDVPWIPVLQGWGLDDYLRHADDYSAAGIDLTAFATVGIGSVCRRQATGEIERIVRRVANLGISLHGFGVKADGLSRYGRHLVSADSLAWSFGARCLPPMKGHSHKHCNNCLPYALRWRQRLVTDIDMRLSDADYEQMELLP